ncbi:YceI family protein [Vibrio sp. D404a]|uniref:YceI family protein n=1 Tax=unclassified Vibrio TaxID=2614977 RepID=UPI0025566CEB|nr:MULTISPECIES: YceI family protein [unclassified Vibrio]MDK9738157.1 YceI family protein [Vibrio sp. D404a]MDK9796448.1 YceI family protein [Vibrio sp. D449a]
MNKMITLLSLGLMSVSFPLFAAGHYQVNEELSTVNFASIKKQYIVEPAVITGVSGKVDDKGMLSIAIPLNRLDTGVSIRNDRLRALFFNEDKFPSVKVSASVPEQLLDEGDMAMQKMLPATVMLYGQSKELIFTVNIVKSGDHLMVSTAKPTVISGFDFGIPQESLSSISNTVGDIAISPSVPVNFSLILEKR